MSNRQDKIKALCCPECGNSTECKMSCDSSHSFKAFKQALIWLPFMTNEQLAQLNFEVWCEAEIRSAREIERDLQIVVDNALKKTHN